MSRRWIATSPPWPPSPPSRGLKLRPHAKTHKSVDIAQRQIAAGALGVCCAKLGEAEALAEGGIENLLITSPVSASRPSSGWWRWRRAAQA